MTEEKVSINVHTDDGDRFPAPPLGNQGRAPAKETYNVNLSPIVIKDWLDANLRSGLL
jgi:hypothetical protein